MCSPTLRKVSLADNSEPSRKFSLVNAPCLAGSFEFLPLEGRAAKSFSNCRMRSIIRSKSVSNTANSRLLLQIGSRSRPHLNSLEYLPRSLGSYNTHCYKRNNGTLVRRKLSLTDPPQWNKHCSISLGLCVSLKTAINTRNCLRGVVIRNKRDSIVSRSQERALLIRQGELL